jgi:hypothetical protein
MNIAVSCEKVLSSFKRPNAGDKEALKQIEAIKKQAVLCKH